METGNRCGCQGAEREAPSPPGETGSGMYLQGYLVPGSGSFVQGRHPISGAEVQVSPAVSESFDHLLRVVQLSS